MIAEQQQRGAEDQAAEREFGRADAEHQLSKLPQAAERQFEPDREKQQDDAELGEKADILGRGNGDVPEPGIVVGEQTEARRPDEQADENVADVSVSDTIGADLMQAGPDWLDV